MITKKQFKLTTEHEKITGIPGDIWNVIQWLSFNKSSVLTVPPNDEVIDFFKNNGWIYKGKAYRGVHPAEKEKKYASWSKDIDVAKTFACQKKGRVEQADVQGLDLDKAVSTMKKWSPRIKSFIENKGIDSQFVTINHKTKTESEIVTDINDIKNKKRIEVYCINFL